MTAVINIGIIVVAIVVISTIVAVRWVDGIDTMKNLHPDYKGEDFP